VNLAVGDVARTDITAPILTQLCERVADRAARAPAEDAVAPVYVEIAPVLISRPAAALPDVVARSVLSILEQRDKSTISADMVRSRLRAALPGFSDDQITAVSTLAADTWTQITDAARTVLDATLSGEVRDDLLDIKVLRR
jgi:hypothetical protein